MREGTAVTEWLEESGLPFHIMRDHPAHYFSKSFHFILENILKIFFSRDPRRDVGSQDGLWLQGASDSGYEVTGE